MKNTRFDRHLWLVDVVSVRARRLGLGLELDDLRQAAFVGLMHADRRMPVDAPDEEFRAFARVRIRGEMFDELRRTTHAARRNYGKVQMQPRQAAPGHVAMARDAGLLPRAVNDDAGELMLAAMGPSPEDAAADRQSAENAWGDIEELPTRTRGIVLRRLRGEPEADIGRTYGLSAVRVNQLAWQAARDIGAKANQDESGSIL